MFQQKAHGHSHNYNKMNEVKINFYSMSINCSSIWTSGKALALSQAAPASDELSVTDLQRGPAYHHACPATWERRESS